jgi:hypothetical protein
MNSGYVGVFPAGVVKPLANNFDGAESATTDGQVGKLLAYYAPNRFAIAFSHTRWRVLRFART